MLNRDRKIMTKRRYAGGIVSVMLIVAVILNFTGCSRFVSDKRLAKKEAEEIFRMLQDEDIEGLSAKFSEDSRKYHNIEMEWESFFKQLDGKLVSYSGISFPGEGKGVDKDGTVYESHLSVNFKNVKTDTDTVYKDFGYYQTRIDTRNPDLQGINVFTMKDPETGTYYNVGGFSSEYDQKKGS
jgi:hypothetical protein